ncbi:hypothetical protein FOA52_006727 [Chlamydomonas sp. UWO 241]|nr:hypothetical protein FOA52_006727 [Chlamydomonas sp. UWO 241]
MITCVGGPTPGPGEARQGRHKQRYSENGARLVAGCIPVRVTGDGSDPSNVQVLLVSSRGGKGYCLPKGGWEDDESVEAAAKRETVEEAGVRGVLEEPGLGQFPFARGKPLPADGPSPPGCVAHMFVMHVEEELEVWPEGHERTRRWFPLLEASARCRYDWMRSALHAWMERKGWSDLLEQAKGQAPIAGMVCDQPSDAAAAATALASSTDADTSTNGASDSVEA